MTPWQRANAERRRANLAAAAARRGAGPFDTPPAAPTTGGMVGLERLLVGATLTRSGRVVPPGTRSLAGTPRAT